MRRLWTAFALLLLTSPAPAQDPDFRDDLRFAEALRTRGDSDLALEFLRKLAPTAPPALAKELPLEFAKTRLRVASEEPDTGKRLALYREARDDFETFIRGNPGHPRLAEANLDIARVLNLQGKTELSRAFLAEDNRSKREQAAQARATLEAAAKQLQAGETELTKLLEKLPDPETIEDAQKKKEARAARLTTGAEIKQTQLERGLNLYDQASTYLAGSGDEAASKILEQAKRLLNPLANAEGNDPIKWKARAWLGRITFETDTADKARAIFQEIIAASSLPSAAEGVRLARYFRLLVIKKQPSDSDQAQGGPNAVIIEAGTRWRNDYRRFLRTPEGVGLTFLLAETMLADADTNKKLAPPVAQRYRIDARALLREVEGSENEFTERARRLKINAMVKQGLLKGDIKFLANFEECFVRAQYEAMQLAQEQKETKSPEEAEKKRKARVDNILLALERGLSLPDAKKMKASTELNTARSMLAYWALNTGKLTSAIAAGESFAREDPRSGQAEMAAVYALQAYSQLIGQKPGKADEAGERGKMFSLAAYMEQRWPRGIGGDVARHSLGLQLLREENYSEAIKKLSRVGSGYANYPLVCFQIADACTKAEKASLEPISGDRPGDYGKRKILALEGMAPDALGPDPFTNQIYVSGKAMLGRDLFRLKRFQQMDDLATGLLGQFGKLRFNDDEDKDRAIRGQLRYELIDVQLYARYGLADAAFAAGDHAKVVKLLDPLVDTVTKSDDSQEKANLQKNQQLASALLILALRSNIQLGKIDRTDVVLDVLDKVSGESGSATNVLRLMAFLIRGQIEELRKKNDKDGVAAATKGYSAILDKRIRKQKDLTPDFIRVLADCYSSMEEHAKAAEELAKVEEPKGAKPGSEEEKVYRRVQLDLIRELRLTKEPDNLKKAREMMNGILGAAKKPGWGRRDLLALKEQGNLLEAEEKYKEAFDQWSDLTRRLAKDAPKGGAVKENYLECYYHMIVSYLKQGQGKAGQKERDKYLKTAALQIIGLEKAWEDFGSEASKKRFTELLAQEPALREMYEAAKKK